MESVKYPEEVLHLRWHLGLGDAIICRGIVLELIKKHVKENECISFPVRENYMESVKDLFINEFKKINFIPSKLEACGFTLNGEPTIKWIGLGQYGDQTIKAESFDRWFYAQAGVDFQRRFDPIPFLKTKTDFIRGSRLAFVHDDPSRGFTIDRSKIKPDLKIVRPCGLPSILDYVPLMEAVDEVHVIDSSFLHLCEHLERTDGLFYHRYARDAGPFHQTVKRKNWTILG